MQPLEVKFSHIEGSELKDMLFTAAYYLNSNEKIINDLNVFPVPDGDTGTNMVLTASGAVAPLKELPDNVPLGKVAELASEAALMSARGNSGVILSQFLRGLARSLSGKSTASPPEMAKAFQYGLVYAYQAVTSPVEGTILTVAREIARGTRKKVRENEILSDILYEALEIGKHALALTPTQLPALKEAGVVDAGGQGLLIFLEGCLAGLEGIIPEDAPETNTAVTLSLGQSVVTTELEFNYCTEALIKSEVAKTEIKKLKSELGGLGDSLLLVEGKGIIKFHLHTNHPGKALEILLKYGSLHDIKIDNMSEQHREKLEITLPMSVVAVSPGEGLDQTFLSLGVTDVVTGGDTMNPSVEQLHRAITATKAEHVVVLPNNSNIRLAAEQAAASAKNKVKIVPTEDVIQGIAAMLSYNPEKTLEENYDKMLESVQAVQSGRITFASRESNWQGRSLNKGAILGFSQNKLLVVADDIAAGTLDLVHELVTEKTELLTLFYGRDVDAAQAEEIAAAIEKKFPEIEIELQHGGQPNDYFLLMIE